MQNRPVFINTLLKSKNQEWRNLVEQRIEAIYERHGQIIREANFRDEKSYRIKEKKNQEGKVIEWETFDSGWLFNSKKFHFYIRNEEKFYEETKKEM
jgi:hypothetical protein